jgi:hypothetical protein
MIKTRDEILSYIRADKNLSATFNGWKEEHQNEFLDFCSGVKGVKLLYDSFFKEVFNPEYAPDRLNDFLSLLIGKKVKISRILQNDSTRIADESALLITDIVVEFEDGSIANVEIQKIGYMFPGQRAACYSSDLLLRQYKRLRSEKDEVFTYKKIKTVYTIVLFENSSKEFHKYTQSYIHKFAQTSDTGIKIDLLQKYIFVPLDIFREIMHNKEIENELEAWLAFLSMDEPEMIVKLIETYPKFQEIYEQIYGMCRNIEGVVAMFSEELRELDRNTVQYMIDVMQDEINAQKGMLDEQKSKLDEQKSQLDEKQLMLDNQQSTISEQKSQLDEKQETIDEQKNEIAELKAIIEAMKK